MYKFRTLANDDALLDTSPIMRAIDFMSTQLEGNPRGIPLTQSGMLSQNIVADAILEIKWPGWTELEIYHGIIPITAADEYHFEPLHLLRQVMFEMGLFRSHRNHLKLSRLGMMLFAERFHCFDAVVHELLFDTHYFNNLRFSSALGGTWNTWLNIIDFEAATGASGKVLTDRIYGSHDAEGAFGPRVSATYNAVLKPLLWTGLLVEHSDFGRTLAKRVFTTTPLWYHYLELDKKRPRLRMMH